MLLEQRDGALEGIANQVSHRAVHFSRCLFRVIALGRDVLPRNLEEGRAKKGTAEKAAKKAAKKPMKKTMKPRDGKSEKREEA